MECDLYAVACTLRTPVDAPSQSQHQPSLHTNGQNARRKARTSDIRLNWARPCLSTALSADCVVGTVASRWHTTSDGVTYSTAAPPVRTLHPQTLPHASHPAVDIRAASPRCGAHSLTSRGVRKRYPSSHKQECVLHSSPPFSGDSCHHSKCPHRRESDLFRFTYAAGPPPMPARPPVRPTSSYISFMRS